MMFERFMAVRASLQVGLTQGLRTQLNKKFTLAMPPKLDYSRFL
jgi:hypothetical protein